MGIGDKILISPELTRMEDWIIGTIIEIEDNPFVGIVISAETDDGDVFFGREYMFQFPSEENSYNQRQTSL